MAICIARRRRGSAHAQAPHCKHATSTRAPSLCTCTPALRTPGLDDSGDIGPALLEADQGDTISGKVTRDEAAATVAYALGSPEAAGKTLELRRSEAASDQGRGMDGRRFNRLFLKLALGERAGRRCRAVAAAAAAVHVAPSLALRVCSLAFVRTPCSRRRGAHCTQCCCTRCCCARVHAADKHRWRVGLAPFPRAVPPPAPPTEERAKEILADPRVAAVREREARARADKEAQQQEQQVKESEQATEKEKELVSASA